MNITPINYSLTNNEYSPAKTSRMQNPTFGLWCKGESWAEKNFITTVRKQRVGHCRKFSEFDVSQFLNGLRKFKDAHEGIVAFRDLLHFAFYEAELDAPLMKNLYTLMAGRDEDKRFAILEYAKYAQDNGSTGLDVMFKLPEDTQEELVGLLGKINKVNNPAEFQGRNDYDYMRDGMFSNFDILVYAHDDKNNSPNGLSDSYKLENFLMLHDSVKMFKNSGLSEGWGNVMNDMQEYFIEKFMNPNC